MILPAYLGWFCHCPTCLCPSPYLCSDSHAWLLPCPLCVCVRAPSCTHVFPSVSPPVVCLPPTSPPPCLPPCLVCLLPISSLLVCPLCAHCVPASPSPSFLPSYLSHDWEDCPAPTTPLPVPPIGAPCPSTTAFPLHTTPLPACPFLHTFPLPYLPSPFPCLPSCTHSAFWVSPCMGTFAPMPPCHLFITLLFSYHVTPLPHTPFPCPLHFTAPCPSPFNLLPYISLIWGGGTRGEEEEDRLPLALPAVLPVWRRALPTEGSEEEGQAECGLCLPCHTHTALPYLWPLAACPLPIYTYYATPLPLPLWCGWFGSYGCFMQDGWWCSHLVPLDFSLGGDALFLCYTCLPHILPHLPVPLPLPRPFTPFVPSPTCAFLGGCCVPHSLPLAWTSLACPVLLPILTLPPFSLSLPLPFPSYPLIPFLFLTPLCVEEDALPPFSHCCQEEDLYMVLPTATTLLPHTLPLPACPIGTPASSPPPLHAYLAPPPGAFPFPCALWFLLPFLPVPDVFLPFPWELVLPFIPFTHVPFAPFPVPTTWNFPFLTTHRDPSLLPCAYTTLPLPLPVQLPLLCSSLPPPFLPAHITFPYTCSLHPYSTTDLLPVFLARWEDGRMCPTVPPALTILP